jgi:hypothetical protein
MSDMDNKIKIEREAFKRAYQHLNLTEERDPWNGIKFKHDMVDAIWEGWLTRSGVKVNAK